MGEGQRRPAAFRCPWTEPSWPHSPRNDICVRNPVVRSYLAGGMDEPTARAGRPDPGGPTTHRP